MDEKNKKDAICNKPNVSVIVPVYNVAKFLPACIESLVAQTLDSIELIFVNDKSPDNSMDILREYQAKYPEKIVVIDSPVNRYQGGARNAGLEVARGEYIGYVDSDDFAGPDLYRTLYENIVSENADIAFIQAASVPEGVSPAEAYSREYTPYCPWNDKVMALSGKDMTDADREMLLTTPIGGVYTMLIRKSILLDNNITFPEKLKYEDNYWGSLMCCYIQRAVMIPEIHYYYVQHAASTVHEKNAAHHMDRLLIEQMLLEEVKRRGLFERYHRAWECSYTKRYAFNSIVLFCGRYQTPPWNEIKTILQNLKRNFPNWRKNALYNANTSLAWKLVHGMIIVSPKMFWLVFTVLRKGKMLCKKIRKN